MDRDQTAVGRGCGGIRSRYVEYFRLCHKLSLHCYTNTQGHCFLAGEFRKSPKFSDAQNVWCIHPKIQTKRFYHRVMHPKDSDSIANSEDPDQTAPLGAV